MKKVKWALSKLNLLKRLKIVDMKISTILTFFLLVCVISCKKEIIQETLYEIPIKYVDKGQKVKLSSIVSDVTYIPLETSKEILLGTIEMIEISDKIYCQQSNKINVFDLKGKSLFEIDHYGMKSPEGYNTISTFRVDSANSMIEIWDRMGRKMVRYDYNTGDFIDSEIFMCAAMSFIKDRNGDYYFYTGTQPNRGLTGKSNDIFYILKFNNKGKFITKYLKVKDNNSVVSSAYSILYSFDGSIYFNPPARNEVYQFKDNAFQDKYLLDFGKKGINVKAFEGKERWGLGDLMKFEDIAWNPGLFHEYNLGYSYVYCLGPGMTYSGFISKSSNNHITTSSDFINDFDGGWRVRTNWIQDEIFVTCIDAYVIKGYYDDIHRQLTTREWDRFKSRHEDFSNAAKNLKDVSNPVVVIMTPKDF